MARVFVLGGLGETWIGSARMDRIRGRVHARRPIENGIVVESIAVSASQVAREPYDSDNESVNYLLMLGRRCKQRQHRTDQIRSDRQGRLRK